MPKKSSVASTKFTSQLNLNWQEREIIQIAWENIPCPVKAFSQLKFVNQNPVVRSIMIGIFVRILEDKNASATNKLEQFSKARIILQSSKRP